MPRAVWVDYADNCTQNKDFRTVSTNRSARRIIVECKTLRVSASYWQEVASGFHFSKTAPRRALKLWSRSASALPARLAQSVASAGLEGGRLTIGVVGAVWASRLRYSTDVIRKRVDQILGPGILSVRIRVVPPAALERLRV